MLGIGLFLVGAVGVLLVAFSFTTLSATEDTDFGCAVILLGFLLAYSGFNGISTIGDLEESLMESKANFNTLSSKYQGMSSEYENLLQATEGYEEKLAVAQTMLAKAHARNEALKTQVSIGKSELLSAKLKYNEATKDMVKQINKVTDIANETDQKLRMCNNTKEAYSEENAELRGVIFKASTLLGGIQ